MYLPYYWEFVRQYVDPALKFANGELTSEDIYNYLISGHMRLFVIRNPLICGAATCEVVQYVRKKAVRVVTLGGENFDAWSETLNNAMLDWASKVGADGIEAYVRKGLVKKLEKLGYHQTYVGMWHGKEERPTDADGS